MPSQGGRELGNEVMLKQLGRTQRHGQEEEEEGTMGEARGQQVGGDTGSPRNEGQGRMVGLWFSQWGTM